MYYLWTWSRVIFATIIDDLITFICILRIYEGSKLVNLGWSFYRRISRTYSMKSSLIPFSRNVESMLPRLRDLLIGAMGLLVI